MIPTGESFPMRRVKLTVAYDGTNYHGWQLQENGKTIESELNHALSHLLNQSIQVIGASRTDAGVHALCNIAVFDTESTIPADKFAYALNQCLPEDIRVRKSEEVALNFHPRKCETRKTYEYHIYHETFPNPLKQRYSYFTHYRLDIEKMQEAADYLVGEHDFTSFCSVHSTAQSPVRTITALSVVCKENDITIVITGNGFLYNMVRIIAGTLIEVGRGKREPIEVKQVLLAKDRTKAGPTLPPNGLLLKKYEFL